QSLVDPGDVAVDDTSAAGGRVVGLREMLLEHTLAEAGLVPGDVIALGPRRWRQGAPEQVKQLHGVPHREAILLVLYSIAHPRGRIRQPRRSAAPKRRPARARPPSMGPPCRPHRSPP